MGSEHIADGGRGPVRFVALRVVRTLALGAALLAGLLPPMNQEQKALTAAVGNAADSAERRLGGRVGIVVWDLRNDARVGRRSAEGFPMASVFKLTVALAIYDAVDRGILRLNDKVAIEPRDLLFDFSRIASDWKRGRKGPYPLRELIDRMLIESDNTAADTLYRLVRGNAPINAVLVRKGISGITVRTNEAGLHVDARAGRTFAKGGDNVGTPDAVANLLAKLQMGTLLSTNSRAQFMNALLASRTGDARLRAGLPPRTPLAHKTGTSAAPERDATIAALARDVYGITRSALARSEIHVAHAPRLRGDTSRCRDCNPSRPAGSVAGTESRNESASNDRRHRTTAGT